MSTQAPTVHHIRRGTIRVGGFTTPDRTLADGSSSHVDREHPRDHDEVRLMVAGQRGVGFGLGAVDADLHRNLGPGLPTAAGPYVYAYGLPGVIDNHGGSAREIAEAKAAGLLLEVEVGDILEIDGNLWQIQFADQGRDRHNLTLTPVEPSPPCAVFTVAPKRVAPGNVFDPRFAR